MKIPIAQPTFLGNEKKYVIDCMDSGWISSKGQYIDQFETEFANYIDVKHAISCSNGTVALHLALLAYDIKPGDEIIVPTLTYIATANAVSYCGATPVFVDSEPGTWNLDPDQLESKITKKTKGIIVVHLYGHPAEMNQIQNIANQYGLFVIEDAAQAHGAQYHGKKIGSIGDIATFSFFGNKIITTGEGGMITTNHDALAAKMRILKGQGMDPTRQFWFPIIGYNYRMTNIQAAIGLAQLETFEQHLAARQKIAKLYFEALSQYDEIIFPEIKQNIFHSFWMLSVTLKNHINRDKMMQALAKVGIETRPVFIPLHKLPPYMKTTDTYPIAEKIAMHSINLPTFSSLSSEEIEYIHQKLAKIGNLTKKNRKSVYNSLG